MGQEMSGVNRQKVAQCRFRKVARWGSDAGRRKRWVICQNKVAAIFTTRATVKQIRDAVDAEIKRLEEENGRINKESS